MITLSTIKGYLQGCGYAPGLLRSDFRFGRDQVVNLAGFAHEPTDARSACIAVLQKANPNASSKDAVIACREVGAPVVFVHEQQNLEFWQQTPDDAKRVGVIPAMKLGEFFRQHKEDLSPDAVYRAKTWARFDKHYQLIFVDVGLMPTVEKTIGNHLSDLVERVVRNLRKTVWPTKLEITDLEGHWLVRSAFWLLAAKILQDKRVHGFVTLDWSNVSDVFRRVAKHYDSRTDAQSPIAIQGQRRLDALGSAAETIVQSGHLGHVTTESLAYVYENTLIDDEARVKLGTHSTPPYLVDYLVAKLRPWIEKIPPEQRDVFEPACGHAAFMVSAMRMLKALLPADKQAERKQYLRKHLHGCETDSFALEIARLSVTLADIPNPNGWDLQNIDMFADNILADQASKSTILLANPPFDNFSKDEKAKYQREGFPVKHINKTAEVLGRMLPVLRPGAVFGVVVPQGFLHSKNSTDVRKCMVEHFEIAEICLFPDKIFTFSDAESAVILGRRLTHRKGISTISYRRVREADSKRFKLDYAVTTKRSMSQNRFSADNDWNMRVPDMEEVWDYLRDKPRLEEIAEVGQGLSYRKKGRKSKITTWSKERFSKAVKGYARLGHDLQIHAHPDEVWMNIDPQVLMSARSGATIKVPQVLMNHACASRGPWRIRAFIDQEGHAFNTNYNVLRPKTDNIPLEYLWALINSPLANVYAYAHSSKRHILPGTLKGMPVPHASAGDIQRLVNMVRDYLHEVTPSSKPLTSGIDKKAARKILKQVDAEVLHLYALPPRLERQILDLFAGQQRVGVPFRFERYFPEDFEPCFSLHEYLSEDYCRSTAGALRAIHEDVASPRLLEALRRATEDFKE